MRHVRGHLMAFAVLILVFAVLYWGFTPGPDGLGSNGKIVEGRISFANAVYFSVVTVTSLGYGDLHPLGYSKTFASAEVLIGLVIMGVMLAKLTSTRTSHHVEMLYRSDMQRRIEEFALEMEEDNRLLEASAKAMLDAFQEVPGKQPVTPKKKKGTVSAFQNHLLRSTARWESFQEYVATEGKEADLWKLAPIATLTRACNAFHRGIFALGQYIMPLDPTARIELLDADTKRRITLAREAATNLSDYVVAACDDNDLKAVAAEIALSAKAVPENIYSAPKIIEESRQPDLTMGKAEPAQ